MVSSMTHKLYRLQQSGYKAWDRRRQYTNKKSLSQNPKYILRLFLRTDFVYFSISLVSFTLIEVIYLQCNIFPLRFKQWIQLVKAGFEFNLCFKRLLCLQILIVLFHLKQHQWIWKFTTYLTLEVCASTYVAITTYLFLKISYKIYVLLTFVPGKIFLIQL